jgi:universal stress protein A
MPQFRRILVPVDFSMHSEAALRLAADLARRYDGALHLVHVFDPVAYPLPDGYVLFTPSQLNELLAQFDRQLTSLKTLALAAGAPQVETHLRQGACATDICDFAKDGAFDLIVMGTHGRSGLSHLLLGSVAERVLRMAPCPVLTVKAPDAVSSPSLQRAASVRPECCN